MKVIDQTLVAHAIASVQRGRSGHTVEFKKKVLRYAVLTTAEHAAVNFGLNGDTVRKWLRNIGLNSAVNGYYFK